jgi:hypothetical protein
MRSSTHRLAVAVAAAVIVVAVLPGAAGATDYCVDPSIDCGANKVDSFQKALDLADDTPDADRIFLGAGTYTAPDKGGFQYYQMDGPVEIVGAGAERTILTSPAGGDYVLGLFGGAATSIHDLTIRLPQDAATGTAGLMTTNAARRIEVVEDPTQANNREGVVLEDGATLDDSSVTLDADGGGATAVELDRGTVRRSVLRAATGVISTYGGTIAHARIVAGYQGVVAYRETTSIRGSLIRLVGANYGSGIFALTNAGYHTAINADGLTIIGHNEASIGAGVGNEGAPAESVDLSLTNSIIRGFPVALWAEAWDAGHANISASYSDYDPSGNYHHGANAEITELNVSNVGDAGFVDAAGDDYHLASGSPLVDIGDPASAQGLDLDGNPLVADGNGDTVARRDLGAFELQPAAAGGAGGGQQVAAADALAPLISGFRAAPSRFAIARRARPSSARTPRGTRFQYALSEQARVTLRIQRALAGRRAGGKCVRPTARLRRAKRCTRYRTVGTLSGNAASGANSTKFMGKFGTRALRPGSYRARITATDTAGNRSAPRIAAFRVVRG